MRILLEGIFYTRTHTVCTVCPSVCVRQTERAGNSKQCTLSHISKNIKI